MKKLVLLMLLVPCPAWAQIPIWDQSTLDPAGVGLVNQEFSDFPTYSAYIVSDIVTYASWQPYRMVSYFMSGSSGPPNWSGLTQGRFIVFPKTGSLPGAGCDPSNGVVVPISVQNGNSNPIVTANLLSLHMRLPAGRYWVGLAPLTAFGTHGQAFAAQALGVHGDPDAIRNPGGAFGFGTAWIPAGTIPGGLPGYEAAFTLWVGPAEPASLVLLILGVLLRRR